MANGDERNTSKWALTLGGLLLAYLVGMGVIVVSAAALNGGDGGGGSSDQAQPAPISLKEFSISGQLMVPAGDVKLAVSNDGSQEHNLVVTETGDSTANLAAGASEELSLGDIEVGSYEVYCSIPGHKDAGMVAQLTVTEDGGGSTEVAAGESGSEGGGSGGAFTMDHSSTDPALWAEADQVMLDSMMKFPAETEGVGNQPLEARIGADGAKEFDLEASIVPWEVEPGVIVDAWAYNGQVPGPAIKVNQGDLVRVNFTNNTPAGSDIHWHGVHTPNEMDGVSPYTQDPVLPGETFVYEFEATDKAVGMYHAHFHSQVSVPNGMFGVFEIGDVDLPRGRTISGIEVPADLVVSQEIPMVLNDAGVIGLSLNGKGFPATAPVATNQGDWLLINYYNEGLLVHPMHMHQFPQIVVAKDGLPLDQPYAADTLLVSPGERYSVLVQTTDPGTWVWHCHILTHAERDSGMFGMVTAVVVT